jgi:UDP-N-acetylmuramate dehydrogenase
MKIDLKELSQEFNDNLKLDYDLKKKIGLILAVKQKFIIKLII